MNKTVNITVIKDLPIKVKFIDTNRHPNDDSYLPISSTVGFITKAGDGLTLIFKERVNYMPGDKLLLKFDDTYGNSVEPTEKE
jgi:hypothetical protein